MTELINNRKIYLSILAVVLLGLAFSISTSTTTHGQENAEKVNVPLNGATVINTKGSIDKVVTGGDNMINVKVNSTQEVIVFGLQEGVTTLHVWTTRGVQEYTLIVAETTQQTLGDKLRQIIVGDDMQKDNMELRVYTPKYREVTEFEKYINELLKDEGEVLLADQPSGKLFVVGDSELLDKVEDLLDRLDVPTEEKVYTKRIVLEHRAAVQIIDNIRQLLTSEDEADELENSEIVLGKAIVDRETNSILIVDTVDKVNTIESYIEQIDVQTVRQVRIQARFVELSDDISTVKGLNWQLLDERVNVDFEPNIPGGATLQPTSAGLSIDNLGLVSGDFQGFVEFLEENDLADLISSPNVVTRNQQPAELVIENQISYVADCEVTLSEGGQTVTAVTETLRDGINLNVTPTVGNNDVIQLEVIPELRIASLGGSTSVSDECAFFTPEVDVRRATLRVALKDGQTLVIGGLTRQEDVFQESTVPYLGKIPIMGALFANTEKRTQKKNIAIFITARIINFEDIGAPDTGPIDINQKDFPREKNPRKLKDASGSHRPVTNP